MRRAIIETTQSGLLGFPVATLVSLRNFRQDCGKPHCYESERNACYSDFSDYYMISI